MKVPFWKRTLTEKYAVITHSNHSEVQDFFDVRGNIRLEEGGEEVDDELALQLSQEGRRCEDFRVGDFMRLLKLVIGLLSKCSLLP